MVMACLSGVEVGYGWVAVIRERSLVRVEALVKAEYGGDRSVDRGEMGRPHA